MKKIRIRPTVKEKIIGYSNYCFIGNRYYTTTHFISNAMRFLDEINLFPNNYYHLTPLK